MKQITHTHVKETKRALRIWIEGNKLAACGFVPDASYNIGFHADAKQIILELSPTGTHKVSNPRTRCRPIIDLHSNKVGAVFAAGDRLEVIFEEGVITIRLHHEEGEKQHREAEFKERQKAGTLREASMFTGGGISSEAIHTATGSSNALCWIAEAEQKYIEAAGENCLCIDDDTTFLLGNVEEIEPRHYTKCDVLSFSMPCAGFSLAGKSKHKQSPIDHSGSTLFGVYNAIRAANPAVIISENVKEAKDSPMYQLLKLELQRLGYKVFEKLLDSSHTDSIENRVRYWLVAYSEGIAPESLDLETVAPSGRCLAEVLEPADESAWASNQYLKDKAVRDAEAGKGFARQLLTGVETRIGTIGRFYQKRRSTEPFLTRGDGMERLLSVTEHASVKSIPHHLIGGLSASCAHEIMGQSVDYRQPLYLTRAALQAVVV